MPDREFQDDIIARLGGNRGKVVPLLCLFYDGDMAQTARATMDAWPRDNYTHAIHVMSAGMDAKKAAEECRVTLTDDSLAELQALNLDLVQRKNPWIAVWCHGARKIHSFVEDFRKELGAVEKRLGDSPIIIYSDSLENLDADKVPQHATSGGTGPDQNTHWIVCSSESVSRHPAAIRGRCTWAHVVTSWRKYCEMITPAPATEPAVMLGLKATFWVHDLGIGHDAPNIDWHAGIVSKIAQESLLGQWLQPSASQKPPEFPSLETLSNALLEKTPCVTDARRKGALPRIATAPTKNNATLAGPVTLTKTPDARQAELPGDTSRQDWPEDRRAYVDYEAYLRLVMLSTCEARAAIGTNRTHDDLLERWKKYFVFPDKPDGMIGVLEKRSAHAMCYAEALADAEATTGDAPTPLAKRFEEIENAVIRCPSGPGLIMRWALLLIGVAWFTVGTLFWNSSGKTLFNDDVLFWVAIMGWAIVAILGGAAAGVWLYRHRLVKARLGFALQGIRERHLQDVCRVIVARLKGLGGALHAVVAPIHGQMEKTTESVKKARKETEEWLEKITTAANALGNGILPDAALATETKVLLDNKPPHFGFRVDQPLWDAYGGNIIPIAHEQAIAEINAGDMTAIVKNCLAAAETACKAAALKILSALSYQVWCAAADLGEENEIKSTVKSCIGASNAGTIPNKENERDTNDPIYIGPESYTRREVSDVLANLKVRKEHLLRHPELPWLVIVRPLPLLKYKIRCPNGKGGES